MASDLKIEQADFENVFRQWKDICVQFPEIVSKAELGIDEKDIDHILEEIIYLIEKLSTLKDGKFRWAQISKRIINSRSELNNYLTNSANNLAFAINQINDFLGAISTIFNLVISVIPIEQSELNENKKINSRIRIAESKIKLSEAQLIKINTQTEELKLNVDEVQKLLITLQSIATEIREIQLRISSNETAINSLVERLKAENEDAKVYAGEILQLKQESEELQKASKNLYTEFDSKKEMIDEYLDGANRYGLAKSFSDKAKNHNKVAQNARWWFLGSVTILTVAGAFVAKMIVENGWDLKISVAKTLIAGPLVWLTIFSANRYSQNTRLGADYEFKEAVAMAYVGYRKETASNQKLLDLLIEESIQTFGSNPVRLLVKHNDSHSPSKTFFNSLRRNKEQ